MRGAADNPFRRLPAVHRLLEHPRIRPLRERFGHRVVKASVETVLTRLRSALVEHGSGCVAVPSLDEIAALVEQEVSCRVAPSLRRVINASGVILHTNLGRAPLSRHAVRALVQAVRYCNLEYDLDSGGRGSRRKHIAALLQDITGAEGALVVNNNAAAVLLVLSALAAGREVVASRGELVEIGGSFRMPDVMQASGARLVEVGTTNKTRISDYRGAITPETALLLKVHPSNYRIIGFTESVPLAELVALGKEFDIPVMFDAGSGLLDRALLPAGVCDPDEPAVREAVASGAAIVTFSGDKLLGGPQAGLVVGRRDLIERCASHPLARALRIDKLSLAALEATLRLYLDLDVARREVPVAWMLGRKAEDIEEVARRFVSLLPPEVERLAQLEIVPSKGGVGGGSMPGTLLESRAVKITTERMSPAELMRRLRLGDPPVIGRAEGEAALLDFLTVLPGEEGMLAEAVSRAIR